MEIVVEGKSLYVEITVKVGNAEFVYSDDKDNSEVQNTSSLKMALHEFSSISETANLLLHAGINDLRIEIDRKAMVGINE